MATSINHLPDHLLSKIVTLATAANPAELTAEVDAADTGQTGESNFTDGFDRSNVAVVCKRWMLLMTTLRVHGGFKSHSETELRNTEPRPMTLSAPAISAPALLRTLALAPRVTALSLEANAVDFYDDEFLSRLLSTRPQLARLSIAHPRFTGSPHFRIGTKAVDNFFRLASSRLQELSLRECFGHTTKLPASVASLSSLRVFRLCSKVLRSLSGEIFRLSALQELYLNCPLLQQLPETFGRLTRLEHLSFTNCKEMRRLPDSLGDLSALTSLHIDGSWHVDRFPPRVGALQQMRRLELRNFNGPLPAACEEWAKLEQVTLDSCADLRTFQLASVHSLTHLTISACWDLQSLPPNLPFATALRHLTINYLNFEVSLEPLSELVSLEGLEVSSVDREESFPTALFALPSLAYVKAGYVWWVVEADEVVAVEESRELTALPDADGHVALNNPAGAAAAAGSGGDTADQSALGPTLKHLSICMGTAGPGRRGVRLSARLCSLLSLTHLSIDCLSSSSLLPSDLGHLTNLRSLSLRGTSLCLPRSLSRLAPRLHSLKLHYSGDRSGDSFQCSLPSFLTDLTSLTHLYLRNMHAPSSPPPSFAPLRALRTLRMEQDSCFPGHVSLPEDLGQLAALEWLELRGCCLRDSLPRSFCDLASLRRLFIGSKSLKHLPTAISKLSRLGELTIHWCHSLETLPSGFGSLGALKKLNIRGVSKDYLPDTLGGLSSLEEVSLALCSHSFSLPPSFCLLPRLLTLTLTSCDDLTTLPANFGSLCSLQRLSVDSCKKFHHLPDSFSGLPSLTLLSISNCPEFSSLPETFGSLPRLTRLIIVECDSFTHLPGSFSSLSALREACFSLCKQLHSLPPTLGLLPRLEVLQLRQCVALKSLPESLREARALRHVDVYGSGVSEEGVEVRVCGKQVHVVRGRMGLPKHVGTKDKGRKGRG
ncbi:unnamed protein product [Closterium sp. NIES-53]